MSNISPPPSPSERYLGLSFSGGGFRAAAFSLGTLSLLQDLGLLDRVSVLSGVSGGSIALGAYLCAKAKSEAEQHVGGRDEAGSFITDFYTPFLHFLSTETMARGFVRLSWLLQRRKLIKAAADANDKLFEQLLGEPALLGSERIRALLTNPQRSPDSIFFNAADISSLNLFRFGLQKHQPSASNQAHHGISNSVDVVVGRWILSPQPQRNPTDSLNGFSKHLRLADCVAASHAFPVGLEPMVFPHDFFSQGGEWAKAIAAFSGSEVCERQEAVGLLDGGLYDNLGLASVEDIRELLNRKRRQSKASALERQAPPSGGCDGPDDAPFVVIATDVDNIQPSISFYDARETSQRVKWRNALLLLGAPWLRCQLNGWVRNALEKLGFSADFVGQNGSSDLKDFKQTLRLRWLLGGWPPLNHLNQLAATLRLNLLVRRLGQPVPMFSGYLKRTRSLTYGYLQTKFRSAHEQGEGDATPHLVRNMIFELTQGADADPDYASALITLPVQTFGSLNDQEEEVYRETSVMRKMRHAHVTADLILHRLKEPGRNPSLLEIWKRGGLEDSQSWGMGDRQLQALIKRLELGHAARLWQQLCKALRVGASASEPAVSQISDSVCSASIRKLLLHTSGLLEGALKATDINDKQVLENCRITPDPVPDHYSWIPLICEMATNLPTTLWIAGYRYYLPNTIVDGRVEVLGGWFSRKPGPDTLADKHRGRPLLDLGAADPEVCPAAAITTLAGYVTTVFNLLEYAYSYLEHSDTLVNGVTRTLSQEQLDCQPAVLELPYQLRQRACRTLSDHWAWVHNPAHRPCCPDPILKGNLEQLKDGQGRLDLLRPWLHSRGPFPASWWQACGPAQPSTERGEA